MPDVLIIFIIICKKWENQILQHQAEKVAQLSSAGTGFTSSSKSPTPLMDLATTSAGTVVEYTGTVPRSFSEQRRMLPYKERAKWFADSRCFHCGGSNHIAAAVVMSK